MLALARTVLWSATLALVAAVLPCPLRAAAPAAGPDLPATFKNPPPGYGPAPLYWWVGERLTLERLVWQLDQLQAKGVMNTAISYNHRPDGSIDKGDPPVFSDAWWDLFKQVVAECKKRGMQIGFIDYTIVNPLLQEIGRNTPDMKGGQLTQTAHAVTGPKEVRLSVGENFVVAAAYRAADGKIRPDSAVDLAANVQGDKLVWKAPAGTWTVVLVSVRRSAFDPMHPEAGKKFLERLYVPFETHCPGEVGKTISTFFQDELHLGPSMPMWSDRLAAEFKKRKGYDLLPVLPALWHDLGPRTPKVRLDYSDVVVSLLEENYFRPIYEWTSQRGVLTGHDQASRGGVVGGCLLYGDYFRTMRWFSAPGNDDPGDRDRRHLTACKVSSSIAHLYERPRTWIEGYHSSGWGVTPARVLAFMNENYAFGDTLLDLHGLYYTTYGGWWEWAPPDFHFRQPYWEHMDAFADYVSRLSYLLTRGVHRCDVAVMYPVAPVEADLGGAEAEKTAFGVGSHLFAQAIDFDFIDFESVARAEVRDKTLAVSGEAYRVLILPHMTAVRQSTLKKALEFYRAGGTVIACGRLPEANDSLGRDDPELAAIVKEIFGLTAADARAGKAAARRSGPAGGTGLFVPKGFEPVKETIDKAIVRDFVPSTSAVYVLHRHIGERDVYFVYNIRNEPVKLEAFFRAKGAIERWDAWTGRATPVFAFREETQGTRLPLALQEREAQLIVFGPGKPGLSLEAPDVDAVTDVADGAKGPTVRGFCRAGGPKTATLQQAGQTILLKGASSPPAPIVLDGLWEFALKPLLDNRWGDFRLPATNALLGAEARQFRYAEESQPDPAWSAADFDDSKWPAVTYSFGPRFWKLGPFPPDADTPTIEAKLLALKKVDPLAPVTLGRKKFSWTPYNFSLRWGIERDPLLLNRMTGPHGLKQKVPDEFIDVTADKPGSSWYLWTTVKSPQAADTRLVLGSRSPAQAWVNGVPALPLGGGKPAATIGPWSIADYTSPTRIAPVKLAAGANRLLLRLVQSERQRLRAYVVLGAAAEEPHLQEGELALRWYAKPGAFLYDPRPAEGHHVGWYRFTSPPGLRSMTLVARGKPSAWANGQALAVESTGQRADGAEVFKATVAAPNPLPVTVALRIEQELGFYGGAALPEPIALDCGPGMAPLGEWSKIGLATYSGGAWYRRDVTLGQEHIDGRVMLELGAVAATAEVRVNGRRADTRIAPPWRVDLTPFVRPGANRIEILVTNTLANHYSVGIPSPYVFPGQTTSGLLGPVRIETWAPVVLQPE